MEPKDLQVELVAVDLRDGVNNLCLKVFFSLSRLHLTFSPHLLLPSEMTPKKVKHMKVIKFST